MTRKVSTRTTWEPVVGYSRAVAAGDFIFVSGCTSVADGVFVHEGDARAQTTQCIANVADALEQLGAGLADRVRTPQFVTDISPYEVVRRRADRVFIPLTVGGGVRSTADVDRLLRAGADRVSLNPAAVARPELLAGAAQGFGSQCVVLSVDARRAPGAAGLPSGF